jgi:ribosomal protein S18 acetylase RimI-like enzyme
MAMVIDNAFEDMLRPVLPERRSRLRVLSAGTDLRAVIGAFLRNELVGVVGLKTDAVSVFDRMSFRLLRHEVGSGAIKATAALKLLDRPLGAGTIRIEFLAVEESARGVGAGNALLRAVEARACDEQIPLIELHVEAANEEARRLYARGGFRDAPAQRDSAPRRWLLGRSDIRMTKEPQCTT